MLAHPSFRIAEAVGEDQRVEIMRMRVGIAAFRRMVRHHEHAQLHRSPPWRDL
jgi:hypothetical protein